MLICESVWLFDCCLAPMKWKKSLWWRKSSFAFYWSQAPGVPSLDPGSAMSAMSAMGGAKMSNLAAQFGCGGGCRDGQWLMERKSREQNSTDHTFYSHLFRPQVFPDLVFFCASFPSFDADNQATVNCTWWYRFQENSEPPQSTYSDHLHNSFLHNKTTPNPPPSNVFPLIPKRFP